MFSGTIADSIGRQKGLLYVNILIIFAAVLNISSKFCKSYEFLIAGRFFAGLFSGFSCSLLPLFLMEISPDHLRGLAGSMNQLTSKILNSFYILINLIFYLILSCYWNSCVKYFRTSIHIRKS